MQHSTIGIPARTGLFQTFHPNLQKKPRTINTRPASDLALVLKDWLKLLRDISQKMTSVYKITPGDTQYIVFTDTLELGAGCVWMSGTYHLYPIVWSVLFPAEVRNRLVTNKNRKGDITNSDLELTGMLLVCLILEAVMPDLNHCHNGMFFDNPPTVAWENKLD